MIYDCFTYNGESDLLEIRFNILSPFVDYFVLVEGLETFSGLPKICHWAERDDRFEEWEDKVAYGVVADYADPEIRQMIEERDYVDDVYFQRAFYQKESIRKVLKELNPADDDIVLYGDSDEITNPKTIEWAKKELDDKTYKLKQLNYSYYLNNRSSEDWRGTIITKYKNVKDGCLNDMRAKPEHFLENGGWHFSNQGGVEAIKKKLASYDHQECNIPWVIDNLEARMEANVDFLGRQADFQGKSFTLWKEDKNLPQYLLSNKERYSKLWKS